MKKIFNWTIGSAFRTFGRIIAYIFVGCLIAFLFHKSGISIYDLIGIGKVSALEISNASVDYVNLTDYGSSEVNIVNSSYKTISTGKMHFALKYHSYINYTSEELPYTSILVICANNTPIRTGQNNYTDVMADSGQTMTAGASCLLDNQTTGTLYYLPLGKKTIAPNSQCTSPCNHFNDWSYTIATNSKIKFSSLMVFNEEDYLLFKNNVATIGKIDEEAQAIIDSQNQNTTDIIDSLGNLGQDIVDNANQNAQDIIDNNKKNFNTCRDSVNLLDTSLLVGNQLTFNNNIYKLTKESDTLRFSKTINFGPLESGNYYFYCNIIDKYNNSDNIRVQFLYNGSTIRYGACNNSISIPSTINQVRIYLSDTLSDGSYITFDKMQLEKNSSFTSYEPYGQEICTNKLDETNNSINNLNDSLNDSDTSSASSDALDFFSNFTTNTHGLTGIITAPLSAIQGLTSSTCTPLHIPIPYLSNKYLDLPCMRDIYTQNFGSFMTLYDTITLGIISYWVMVRIFALVKDFKNPDHDEIEVMDL